MLDGCGRNAADDRSTDPSPLEGLDGVLEDGLDGLHNTEAALHIVDLGLHALDGLHLAGDLLLRIWHFLLSILFYRKYDYSRQWLNLALRAYF